ncbi:homoserine dehydrogenase [Candidatus Desantisbacteria bacterium CG2_30_40_21]|uniref:Homoserine dehydrogenase n=5 Tax=unclassified Candidatus Desantisiibacteriota TaxID=3106372 RepID=A0A2M7JDJ3_9BACT|nr:MAG: homoserine dehydrogenase [Candidatus Desantisbacteria bacterium CG2_30_40_21]PIP39921.1 MAG: homoserine dehydrogenase [Candidatus Desantisbacteria bacterium CG23_combo_of_CG06-09_8_20_14_all_40_23]PIX17470.1 MAG: homoserine dehydrogenase [Candidatus Desantisbacteria bacterium CG_4_8_14_3_um_filter_40_12]PIY18630.1 MAG: homoserine dehydrogenase [Candidatus Desantisbacteria bacterium CG_4_10_14_3_um_filter_40_18]PJB29100.1 MAG: homoserine dehydrogenase [Candidatus Desantisbacteria bacteri
MQLNIGLIGFGTIGAGVVKILQKSAGLIEKRTGVRLCLKRIADLDITTSRGVVVGTGLLTTKAEEIIGANDIDVVIELIGGYEPARTIVLSAMRAGKNIVTANKALLSKYWEEIFQTAAECQVAFYAEASVGGGIPLISSITQGLVANEIQEVYGIINGTCNYILTRMSEEGLEFSEALKQAQANGYAEADPAFDIDGIDTAHKLSILSSISFGGHIPLDNISIEGITRITKQDIDYAKELGFVIKLLGIAKRLSANEIEVRVHPAMIPQDHLLASVHDVFNAVYLIGDMVGPMMFYGKGAGQLPTASAIIGDLIMLAHQRKGLAPLLMEGNKIKVRKADSISSKYYLRVTAEDRPGVLADIAGILGGHGISIASCIQKERGEFVPIIMLTHEAEEGKLRAAITKIDSLTEIKDKTVVIRVTG